ncbi:MAG: SDR family oxidoreductase [Deinococcales bacterium]
MKAIVLGASGLVGNALLEQAPRRLSVVGTTHTQVCSDLVRLDIRDPKAVAAALADMNVVFMPAAFANVDACERDPLASRAVNVEGVQNVVRVCRDTAATLVYYSSDYVFNGKNGPYAEMDTPYPICEYGRQKWEAEQIVASLEHHLILRTTWVVGLERLGKNFLYRVVQTLRRGETLLVPNDQFGQPTSALDLARASWELVHNGSRGLFHVAGQTLQSRLEFAHLIADVFGLSDATIRGVSSDQLGQIALRPLHGGLISARVEAILGWQMSSAQTVVQNLYGSL